MRLPPSRSARHRHLAPPTLHPSLTRRSFSVLILLLIAFPPTQGIALADDVPAPSAVATSSPQEEPKPGPPPLTYMGRQIAPPMSYSGASWLTRETRAREENPEQLLKALNLKP